jgi:hypothetical protein
LVTLFFTPFNPLHNLAKKINQSGDKGRSKNIPNSNPSLSALGIFGGVSAIYTFFFSWAFTLAFHLQHMPRQLLVDVLIQFKNGLYIFSKKIFP